MDFLSPERVLILSPHQDDEAIGAGVLMQRAREAQVVFLTTGVPRDKYFWGRFGSAEKYQVIREEEAAAALKLAGVSNINFLGADLHIVDQELFRNLPRACSALRNLVTGWRPDAIFAPAYEGGHPDHDSANYLAAQLAGQSRLPVWEFPLYSRPQGKWLKQQFLTPNGGEASLTVRKEESATKHRMFLCYASQSLMLADFRHDEEIFRPLPGYDYSRPPHEGPLNYEAWGWPIRGADLCRAFGEFQGQAATR